MNNLFECIVRYEKTTEDGLIRKVSELYLIEALSFTEAEARIIEEVTPFTNGDFSLSAIKRPRISEVFYSQEEGCKWYRCKLAYITLDDKRGVEKRIKTQVLVEALNMHDAMLRVEGLMNDAISDYSILSLQETEIVDLIS